MASESQGRTLRDVFYEELREFWDACGTPSMRVLAKISEQLAELYGEQYRSLPSLGRSTISDLLRGNREGLPATDLTSSVILSLQRFAWVSGGADEDPGPAGLRGWHDRLRYFRKLGADTPADVLEDRRPPSAGLDANAVGTGPDERDDPPATEMPEAEHEQQRSLTQQRFHDSFGPYGLELLAGADDRHDPESAYRIALLLYLESHPREALAWLMKAVRAEHFMATQLSEADDPLAAARGHAFSLGSFAFAACDYEVAQIYYERAARHGHVEAAFELGLLFIDISEPTRATYWLNRAAEGGHEYASSRFEDIHRVLLGQAFACLPSDETGMPSALTVEDLRGPADDPDATPPFGLQTWG